MTLLDSLSSKLSVRKGEGMAGIGADQTALNDSSTDQNPNTASTLENIPAENSGGGHHGAFGTPGTHSGRSDAGPHDNKTLNTLDPRVGDLDYDDHNRKYEAKYGTAPDINVAKRQDEASKTMNGFGVDQSELFPKDPNVKGGY